MGEEGERIDWSAIDGSDPAAAAAEARYRQAHPDEATELDERADGDEEADRRDDLADQRDYDPDVAGALDWQAALTGLATRHQTDPERILAWDWRRLCSAWARTLDEGSRERAREERRRAHAEEATTLARLERELASR